MRLKFFISFVFTVLLSTSLFSDSRVMALLKDEADEQSLVDSLDLKTQEIELLKTISLVSGKKIVVLRSSVLDLTQLTNYLLLSPRVQHVAEDKFIKVQATPNDPDFDQQWGVQNTNNPITDINATEAWKVTTGSEGVVVGIIDTGVDYRHNDLQKNIWTNPYEIADNGIDDDGNGYTDDIHGWDALDHDNDPIDDGSDGGHGTHCAGSIGAVGNNGLGTTGVNWSVKIAPCRFLDSKGGYSSGAIECINYFTRLKQEGINLVVINNSWGSGDLILGTLLGDDPYVKPAIEFANEAGILFVVSAGNEGTNNDIFASYPANYDVANVISVAASDIDGNIASFSNYGSSNVDLAAPGVDILSTYPGDRYERMDGTSMAAPYVSGALALLASVDGGLSAAERKEILLENVTYKSDYRFEVASSGLLNIGAMIGSLGIEEEQVDNTDETSNSSSSVQATSSASHGGGCSLSMNMKQFDLSLFITLLFAVIYRYRRSFIDLPFLKRSLSYVK